MTDLFEQLAKDLEPVTATPDCNTCDGKGRIWYPGCGDTDTPCDDCNGTGYSDETTL
jgi:DnaJ-class molecular chaperone